MSKLDQLGKRLQKIESQYQELEQARKDAKEKYAEQKRKNVNRRKFLVGASMLAQVDWNLLKAVVDPGVTRRGDREFLELSLTIPRDYQSGDLTLVIALGLMQFKKAGREKVLQNLIEHGVHEQLPTLNQLGQRAGLLTADPDESEIDQDSAYGAAS